MEDPDKHARSENAGSDQQNVLKRAYSSPEFRIFGLVRDLTMGPSAPNADGGSGMAMA